MESKKEKIGIILFALLVVASLIFGASWSSYQSDLEAQSAEPAYQAKSFGYYIVVYPMAITFAVLVVGGAVLLVIKARSCLKNSRRRRLDKNFKRIIRKSDAYLPNFKK